MKSTLVISLSHSELVQILDKYFLEQGKYTIFKYNKMRVVVSAPPNMSFECQLFSDGEGRTEEAPQPIQANIAPFKRLLRPVE